MPVAQIPQKTLDNYVSAEVAKASHSPRAYVFKDAVGRLAMRTIPYLVGLEALTPVQVDLRTCAFAGTLMAVMSGVDALLYGRSDSSLESYILTEMRARSSPVSLKTTAIVAAGLGALAATISYFSDWSHTQELTTFMAALPFCDYAGDRMSHALLRRRVAAFEQKHYADGTSISS